MKKLIPLALLIIGIILIIFSYHTYLKIQDGYCYKKCSDYHYLGEDIHWDYNDFVIDNSDTIWLDRECYNDWCICIDECKTGLCCEFLR